jgi:hypothetical protein
VSEKEFVRDLNRIVRESGIAEDAIEKTQALFAAEFGVTRLLLRPLLWHASIFGEPVVRDFIESRSFPFRGVYTAPLGADGVLIACIGSWGAPIETIQSRVEHAAARLAPLSVMAQDRAARQSEAA